jgi:hypothetical protein
MMKGTTVKNINSWLDNIPGLKTEKGAMKRLDAVMNIIDESGSKYMVYRKGDGSFVPLVFLNSNGGWAAGLFAHRGICVTN